MEISNEFNPHQRSAFMYSLVYCHVRIKNQWEAIDPQNMSILSLVRSYQKVRLFVEPDYAPTEIHAIELSDKFGLVNPTKYTNTVDAWLLTDLPPDIIDKNPLNTTLDNVGCLKRVDLWKYPVDVQYANHNYGIGVDIPRGLEIDIVISAEDTDISVIEHLELNALFVVNGRVLESSRLDDRIFIHNAKAYIKGKEHFPTISVLEIGSLGEHDWLPLTEDVMSLVTPNETDIANNRSRIKVDISQSIAESTVLAVINGYPHFLDGSLLVTGGNSVILTLDNTLLCRRALRDDPHFWRGVDGINVRDSGLNVEVFDPIEHLSSGTSALIIIHNSDVNRQCDLMGRTDVFGYYTFPYTPQGIVISESGDYLDYIIMGYDGSQASISVVDNLKEIPADTMRSKDKDKIVTMSRFATFNRPLVEARMINLYTTRKI